MYYIEPYYSKCLITPNHNLLVSNCHRNIENSFSIKYNSKSANWQLKSIGNLIESRRSHFHVWKHAHSTALDYDIPDEYLILAGLYISDGTSNVGNSVDIVQLFARNII